MRVIRHPSDLPADARGAVAALGNFDGVHLGHLALIGEARRIARQTGRPLAAIVFEPNPREFFRPGDPPFRLTPFRVKARLFTELGLDQLIVLTFDTGLAAMSAPDFVAHVLVGGLSVSHIVVGGDFRFGKGRSGDAASLAAMGETSNFGVTLASAVAGPGGGKISSSEIRAALRACRPEVAARLLGRWWSVEGHVSSGDRRGRQIGFPTANLKLEHTLLPAYGVYAVRVEVDGVVHDGVANFGIRPMFALPAPLLEAHLFDFTGDLYGKLLKVELIAYLRGEEKFDDLEALKAQIARDSAEARRILATATIGSIP